MNAKKLIPVICMISVLVMLVWGYLAHSFKHSWLAVFAGGIIVAAISILSRDKEDKK